MIRILVSLKDDFFAQFKEVSAIEMHNYSPKILRTQNNFDVWYILLRNIFPWTKMNRYLDEESSLALKKRKIDDLTADERMAVELHKEQKYL